MCAYCDDERDGNVGIVAECTARCEVVAHDECFSSREKSSTTWRNKHRHRGNHEAELCPHPGCQGRLVVRKAKKDDYPVYHLFPPTRVVEDDSPVTGPLCSFLTRQGLPCHREALEGSTGCKLHAKNATALEEALTTVGDSKKKAVGDSKKKAPRMVDAATQFRGQVRTCGTETDPLSMLAAMELCPAVRHRVTAAEERAKKAEERVSKVEERVKQLEALFASARADAVAEMRGLLECMM